MMIKLQKSDMDKLPKWAQRHLEMCYNNIDSLARDKAALFHVLPDDAQVLLTHFHGANGENEDDQPLRKYQRVKFLPLGPDTGRWQNYIEVGLTHDRPGEINIHGNGTIEIIPHATNSFNVRLEKERK